MVLVLLVAVLVLLVITSFAVTIYLVLGNNTRNTGSFNVQVVQIPQNTMFSSINDVESLCQQNGGSLATADNINTVISKINYTYCTRGYINNATIAPVSPGTNFPGCPSGEGLHLQPSTFPCVEGAPVGTMPSCEAVAFCYKQSNT